MRRRRAIIGTDDIELRAGPAGGESVAKIYTRQEVKRRRLNFQIFAGIYDFIGAVAGIVVIVACAFLLRGALCVYKS